jgi:hypothetical protein
MTDLPSNVGSPNDPKWRLREARTLMLWLQDWQRGLREEGRSRKLADVFSWSQLHCMTRWGFNERQEHGVIVLDLSLSADALFVKSRRPGGLISEMRSRQELR